MVYGVCSARLPYPDSLDRAW